MTILDLVYEDRGQLGWDEGPPGAMLKQPTSRSETLVEDALPEPQWREITQTRLNKLLGYRLGWDGYNGRPPKAGVVGFVQSLLESTMPPTAPPPSVVPMSGGGVQLEWHTAGFDIELAVYAPFHAELSVEYPDDREAFEEQTITSDFSALGGLMAELA